MKKVKRDADKKIMTGTNGHQLCFSQYCDRYTFIWK